MTEFIKISDVSPVSSHIQIPSWDQYHVSELVSPVGRAASFQNLSILWGGLGRCQVSPPWMPLVWKVSCHECVGSSCVLSEEKVPTYRDRVTRPDPVCRGHAEEPQQECELVVLGLPQEIRQQEGVVGRGLGRGAGGRASNEGSRILIITENAPTFSMLC